VQTASAFQPQDAYLTTAVRSVELPFPHSAQGFHVVHAEVHWVTYNETLHEAGLIYNATTCSIIASDEVRTLPVLQETLRAQPRAPLLYLPDKSAVLAEHEVPQIAETLTANIKQLDELREHRMAPQRSYDVDTLFHVHQATRRQESKSYCHWIVTTASCTVAILLLLHLVLRSYYCHIFLLCITPRNPAVAQSEPTTSPRNHSSRTHRT
jgi:hypothetical protein